jgi:hypothetical protein
LGAIADWLPALHWINALFLGVLFNRLDSSRIL